MNLLDILVKYNRLSPKATALVEIRPLSGKRHEITWESLYERTNRLANTLLLQGIGKGDTVFLYAHNSIAWLEVYFGVMKTGACVVPLNYRFTDKELMYCREIAHPKAFFFGPQFGSRISALQCELTGVRQYACLDSEVTPFDSLDELISRGGPSDPNTELFDDGAAGLYFTSGTTGNPKPVLMTHKNLFSAAIIEAFNHRLLSSDALLMMPPFYHLAIGHLTGNMLVGGRSVLLTEKISPQTIIQTMSDEKISVVFLLVPWAVDILEALDKGRLSPSDFDLDAWRLTHMGAQPIPPVLVQRLKQYFPGMLYDTCYGLSEAAGPGVLNLGIENEHKIGATGKAGLLWDTRIVDHEGRDVAKGEVGELIVKGPGVMREYYDNPELTAETVRDGWLFTGDLARFDADDFIWVVDRKKDLVISGGENIFPVEIEKTIIQHPKVHDVAVIGTPDNRLGEIVTAVIQVVEGEKLLEEEISVFCEACLPRYKRPRCIIFDKVPRNPTGKLNKPLLRQKFAAPKKEGI
jgi:acyl-CoA synthetase (AMP-forming)/AMP-acid ligase II